MKADFAARLRCPICHRDGTIELSVEIADKREVREGALRCRACVGEFRVRRGVAELLHDPPQHILDEAAGLERFAEKMRLEGWDREMVLRMPDLEHGYWYVQARSMHQLLTMVPFIAGQSILDIGSNTCWAANHFAERGMRAIALDIATVELQGLYTADYFIEAGRSYFERILGTMDSIPLASGSLDYVYCCQVLHHNDLASLRRTFTEIFRVLRPGGRLLMVNETLKTLCDRSGVHVEGVEQFEGYEHAHWALRYRWEATRAGFMTAVTEPHYHPFFGDEWGPEEEALPRWLGSLERSLRCNDVARRVYLAWLDHVTGGVSMNMIATKPLRYASRPEGLSAPSRLVRLVAAWARLRDDRGKGLAPERLPRTPAQISEALRRARGASGA